MTVKLYLSDKVFDIQIGMPTFFRKEKVRELDLSLVRNVERIENSYKDIDLTKDIVRAVEKAGKLTRLSDLATVEYFIAIATNVPEELQLFFKNPNTDFWKEQSIAEMDKAISFFRNGKEG